MVSRQDICVHYNAFDVILAQLWPLLLLFDYANPFLLLLSRCVFFYYMQRDHHSATCVHSGFPSSFFFFFFFTCQRPEGGSTCPSGFLSVWSFLYFLVVVPGALLPFFPGEWLKKERRHSAVDLPLRCDFNTATCCLTLPLRALRLFPLLIGLTVSVFCQNL